jgi:hypothetical protein
MDRDLDTIDPQPAIVTLKGVDREIRPVVAGNIPRLVRAVQPFLEQLLAMDPEVLQAPAEHVSDAIAFVVGLVGEHGESALEAISAATRIPRKEIDELEGDELFALAVKAWEVNSDFFTRKLGPLLAGRATGASGDGPTR